MLIQAILLGAVVVLLALFVRGSHTVKVQAVKRLAFLAFLLMSCDAVLRPQDTSWLAHKVGVGRGADLLLYITVVVFAFNSANTHMRFRNLEQRFTDLVRSMAIRDAQVPARIPVQVLVPGQAQGGTRSQAVPIPSPAPIPVEESIGTPETAGTHAGLSGTADDEQADVRSRV